MRTLSHHEFLRHSSGNSRGTPRVVRFKSRRAHQTTVRNPGKAARIDRDMVWLIALSVLGMTLSFLLAAAFPLLDAGEDASALAAASTATMSASPALVPASTATQPTLHEQFNLHPTEGDVEEAVATF